MTVRIIMVDDNQRFRETLKQHLQQEPEVTVVGEACDGEEAVRLAQKLRPDLVLMDISMPGANGLVATKEIKDTRPEIKVIMLSIHREQTYLTAAKEAGSDGYVVKGDLMKALLPLIRQVTAEGEAKEAS
ncbi:MAG: hypothetical protein A2038_08175 [Deltaproteobacteria bacterium GWA2_57_13]|nr:MAG: hypothetical protein A2038_08175 [Deltaproteobacteria bacterium GWA2_57_13]OGQ77795.1 MAG: hypothetical protein A3G40_05595 [Deltaproteobacteria bacterium RIFCSPLOWO2_12_FULL_57_22]